MEDLIERLSRYSELCIANQLDYDFAEAIVDVIEILRNLKFLSQLTKQPVEIDTCIYDKEEIIENCTLQVLTNTVTGETSVGWWRT
jgi:hypothetical protein